MKHAYRYEIKLRREAESEVYRMTGDRMTSEEQVQIFEWGEEGDPIQIAAFLNWEYCVQLPKEKDPET
jgi:hypothetical protein